MNVVTLALWRMLADGKKRPRILKHQTKSSTDAEERGGDWALSKMKDKQRKKIVSSARRGLQSSVTSGEKFLADTER